MKRILTAIIALTVFTSVLTTAAAASQKKTNSKTIGIVVNGEKLELAANPVIINGRTLVPVRTIFEKFNADVKWYPVSSSVRITAAESEMSMRIGSKRTYVNEKLKMLDAAPALINGVTMVPIRFIAETLNSKVGWDPDTSTVSIKTGAVPPRTSRGEADRSFKVVIDAGHGGRDPGARYFGYSEKALNLKIAQLLDEKLKAEGVKTYMTRTGDKTLSLHERSELANGVDADLMVSVHNNAGNKKTTGSMTLYYPGNHNSRGNLSAKEFAQIVQDKLVGTLGAKDLGEISRPNLAVLRIANMPSVIAEVGYMSNINEMKKLGTHSYREKAAEALKDAVMEALKRI